MNETYKIPEVWAVSCSVDAELTGESKAAGCLRLFMESQMYFETRIQTHKLRPLARGFDRSYFQKIDRKVGDREKSEQRLRITKFFVDAFEEYRIRQLKVFSYPAIYWRWERQLQRAITCPEKLFIGVERFRDVQLKSRKHILGGKPHARRWRTACDDVIGYETRSARSIHFQAERLWMIDPFEMGDADEFHRQFLDWTGAWIDPCCPLTGHFAAALPYMLNRFSATAPVCPLAVSFVIGRDNWTTKRDELALNPRLDALLRIFARNKKRRFELIDAFTYRRYGRSSLMGTVLGLVHLP